MSTSSDVKYLNSCVGVFTGFAHGSNPRKLDKEGQVEIVAPNPIPLELASKSIPAAEWKGIRMLVAGRSFPRWCWAKLCIPFFSVFLCAGAVVGFRDLLIHIRNIFCGFCFSFLFKAASEVLKLIALLISEYFWIRGGYFVWHTVSKWLLFTMLQWTALGHIKKNSILSEKLRVGSPYCAFL